MKKILIFVPLIIIVFAAFWFYKNAQNEAGYYGLPAVSCVDPTEKILQDYSFNLKIEIAGKNIPLDPNIGHDPGDCLRIIHTDDASGKVIVQSNSATEKYTLGEFFNVWHKNFTANEILGYSVTTGHKLQVYVDNQPVSTFAETEITPNSSLLVYYN